LRKSPYERAAVRGVRSGKLKRNEFCKIWSRSVAIRSTEDLINAFGVREFGETANMGAVFWFVETRIV